MAGTAGAVHGVTLYRNHGCRCDECRSAVAASARDYRRRHGSSGRKSAGVRQAFGGQCATVHQACGGLLAEDDAGRVFCLRCQPDGCD